MHLNMNHVMTNIAFVVTNAMTATTNIRQNILSLHMRHHFTIKVPTHTKYTIFVNTDKKLT